MLRNLTTKELVRAEAIALKPEYIRGPHISHLGFGEVVLSRIAWSTSDTVAMNYNSQPGVCIHRGVWAGHRFDIVMVAEHSKQTMRSKAFFRRAFRAAAGEPGVERCE